MTDPKKERKAQRTSGNDQLRSDRNDPASSTRLTAGEIYDNVRVAAEEELVRPTAALLWSAIAAGLTIGFSFFAGAYFMTLVSPAFKGPAGALGYPLGFIFVVLARSQLFTENTLEPVIPFLHRPGWSVLKPLLSLWGIVLLGNLIGAFIFALIAATTPMVDEAIKSALMEFAESSTSGGFLLVAYRAIYAGWLIALMAWLIASTRSTGAQIVLVFLTTAPIGALGFRHSIAGAVEAFYRCFAGSAGWLEMWARFIIPALIGNIIGGVLFVALLNHGQVSADRAADDNQ